MATFWHPNHESAVEWFRAAVEAQEELLIHNAILTEATALLQRRLGLAAAVRFLDSSDQFIIHWVGARDHSEAVELLKERGRRGLSLVDCTSFAVMRRLQVTQSLIAPARRSFTLKDKHTVSHGGLCIEEVIVPFAQITRAT